MTYHCASCKQIIPQTLAMQTNACPVCGKPLSLSFQPESALIAQGYGIHTPSGVVSAPTAPQTPDSLATNIIPTPADPPPVRDAQIADMEPTPAENPIPPRRGRSDRLSWMDPDPVTPDPTPVQPAPVPDPPVSCEETPESLPDFLIPHPQESVVPGTDISDVPGNITGNTGRRNRRTGVSGEFTIPWQPVLQILLFLLVTAAGGILIYTIWTVRYAIIEVLTIALVIAVFVIVAIFLFRTRRR